MSRIPKGFSISDDDEGVEAAAVRAGAGAGARDEPLVGAGTACMMPPMKTYVRYLLAQLAWPMLFAGLAFSGTVWLSQSLRLVDLIVNKGLPPATFLYLTLLLFPSLLLVILPFSLLFAVLFAYHRLTTESELTALKAAGLSNLQLAAPGLALAALVTAVAYAVSLYFMPLTSRSFKDLQYELRQELSRVLLEPGVFTSPVDHVTVYVREHADDGRLHGILVHDDRDRQRPVTMMAEDGFLVEGGAAGTAAAAAGTTAGAPAGGSPRFVLRNGSRQEFDAEGGGVSILYFDRYTLDLAATVKPATGRWRKPKERYLHELLNPDEADPQDRKAYGELVAEGHQRLTWPLNALVFALIGIAALLPRSHTRRGPWPAVLAAVAAALAVQALSLAAGGLAARSLVLLPLLYVVPLAPAAVCLALIAGRRRPGALAAAAWRRPRRRGAPPPLAA